MRHGKGGDDLQQSSQAAAEQQQTDDEEDVVRTDENMVDALGEEFSNNLKSALTGAERNHDGGDGVLENLRALHSIAAMHGEERAVPGIVGEKLAFDRETGGLLRPGGLEFHADVALVRHADESGGFKCQGRACGGAAQAGVNEFVEHGLLRGQDGGLEQHVRLHGRQVMREISRGSENGDRHTVRRGTEVHVAGRLVVRLDRSRGQQREKQQDEGFH